MATPFQRSLESDMKLNIWIYGAGAVGCYYGSKLQLAGNNVLFIARGKQLEALKNNGLKVQSCNGDYQINPIQCCSEEELSSQSKPDLVLVSVKRYSNEEVTETLSKRLDNKIPIFVLQNGIKSEEIYKKQLGEQRVYRAIMNIAASLKSPGELFHKSGGTIILEDKREFAKKLFSDFDAQKVDCKLEKDIQKAIWNKILWNAPFNTVTALTKQTTTPIIQDPDGLRLLKSIATEVIQLAQANNVDITEATFEKHLDFTLNKLGDITTSTREDVLEGKPIEYEAVVGDLIDEADGLDIDVPHVRTVFSLLKLL